MGNRVNRVRTPVSEAQMAQAIIEGWRDLVGTTPTKDQVAIILSQNALETANRNSMWNYNVGNITTNGKDKYDFFDDLATDEQIKPGKWTKMNLKYRAYSSLKDGIEDYLRFIYKNYPEAWQSIVNPDPSALSKGLKQRGYYTADETPYAKSLSKWYSQFSKSNSYEDAQSGKIPSSNVLVLNKSVPSSIDNILNSYIREIAASSKIFYKKYLPNNNAVINIVSSDQTNSLEFARILTVALNEELFANASIHADKDCIEVDFSIPGPAIECFAAVDQLTKSLAEVFFDATKKIGGIEVKTQLFTNKKSSYRLISLNKSEIEHRKFLLKFA